MAVRVWGVGSRRGRRSVSAESAAFGALWTASAATNLADGLFKFALPVLAARQTDSPGLVAGVGVALTLPWLLFALHAGALVDRLDRRQVMIGANLLRGGVVALLAVTIGAGWDAIALLYVAALLAGIAETLADTAATAVLPTIIASNRLEGANARLIGTQTAANEFVGPPLGGLLIALGAAFTVGSSAALYLGGAVILLGLPARRAARFDAGLLRTSLTAEIVAGLRYLWGNALLRALAVIVAVMNLGWSAWLAVLVLFAVEPGPMGLSTVEYGVLLTGLGVGGLAGTVLAGPILGRIGRRWAILADILGTVLLVGAPAVTSNVWLIGAVVILGGLGGTMWGVVVVSIRQQVVPDELQGRVGGAFRLFGYGAMAVGAALAGIVAELIGVRAVFAIGAALNLLLLVPFFTTITERAMTGARREVVERELSRVTHKTANDQRGV